MARCPIYCGSIMVMRNLQAILAVLVVSGIDIASTVQHPILPL